MHSSRLNFIETMTRRGFLAQCTDIDGLKRKMTQGQITAYIGFDATADSLHVGHLVSLMSMRWLAACGHNVIALVGGSTTMVGDPSFRNASRPLLAPEDIARNIEGIKANIKTVMQGHDDKLIIVNNEEWLGEFGLIDFMRRVGIHFSVPRMLSMDAVKNRLGDGGSLSMLEFTYMMLQSADFLELNRRHDCSLQMGGSDQWGNIVHGIELIRRSESKEAFGLTTPLLTKANGEKMGKSKDDAIWLSPAKMDAFSFWQFWRNTDDADVRRFLLLFTELSLEDVDQLVCAGSHGLNHAKSVLATNVTALIHGCEKAEEAAKRAKMLFEGRVDDVTHVIADAGNGIPLPTILCRLNFAQSKGAARRLIEQGGVRVNGTQIRNPDMKIEPSEQNTAISAGKRNRAVIKVER